MENNESKKYEYLPATVSCQSFAKDLGLEIVVEGRGEMELEDVSISRPGLQLAGFFNYFPFHRVQILGNAESEYLKNLDPDRRNMCLKELFKRSLPCVIVSRDIQISDELMQNSIEASCPLFRSSKVTSALSNEVIMYLNKLLAPTSTRHGVLVDVSDIGILLVGKSGIGKSETALELIKRGHRLVADDLVVLKKVGDKVLGNAPKKIKNYMEIRGIGIINIPRMYGAGAVTDQKEIDLVIELENWDEEKEYDRLGVTEQTTEVMGEILPKLVIPVKPGRNLAIIIEVAARNLRLKSFGYNAATELLTKLKLI